MAAIITYVWDGIFNLFGFEFKYLVSKQITERDRTDSVYRDLNLCYELL